MKKPYRQTHSASLPVTFRHCLKPALLAAVLLSACDVSSPQSVAGSGAGGSLPDEMLKQLWSDRQTDVSDGAILPIRFPEDLAAHPNAGAESYQLRSILRRSDGEMISIQVQLDRLALNMEASADSDWGFSQLMRASVAFATSGQLAPSLRETLERRALGLADSRAESIFVTDTQLGYQPRAGLDVEAGSAELCQGSFRLATMLPEPPGEPSLSNANVSRLAPVSTAPIGATNLQLAIELSVCPDTVSLQGLNRWQGSGLKSVAKLVDSRSSATESDDRQWQGHSWLSHSWGSLPAPGGAVLIDQVQLQLQAQDGSSDLSLTATRSKRKSGRGPQTVQAALRDTGDPAKGEQVLEIEWLDEGEQVSPVSGTHYPQRFRLRTRDKTMDLLLRPLVGLPELKDSLGTRWDGAVIVSGTHTGMGFVDFQPQENSQEQ